MRTFQLKGSALLAGRKLLLADDSITIQKVVDLTFADEGVEVVAVNNGAEAIEKLDELTPDVVLADVFMPEVSGYQVCEYIKNTDKLKRIPVMLLVGSFEPFDEAEARRVGANDILSKPFQSIRSLVDKVSVLLGGGAARSQQVVEPPPAQTEHPAETASSALPVSGSESPTAPLQAEHPVETAGGAPPAGEPVPPTIPLPEISDLRPERLEPDELELTTADTLPLLPKEPELEPANQEAEAASMPAASIEPDLETAKERPMEQQIISSMPAEPFDEFGDSLLDLDYIQPVMAVADDSVLELDELVPAAAASVDFVESGSVGEVTISDFASPEPPIVWNEPAPEPVERGADTAQTEYLRESVAEEQPPVTKTSARQAESDIEPVHFTELEPPPVVAAGTPEQIAQQISPEVINAIARRVVEQLSEKAVQEIAWEVVPQLAELLIKRRLDEKEAQIQ